MNSETKDAEGCAATRSAVKGFYTNTYVVRVCFGVLDEYIEITVFIKYARIQ